MKKLLALAAVVALTGIAVSQSNATIKFQETFNAYTGINDPAFTSSWDIFGLEYVSDSAQFLNDGDGRGNYLSLDFNSPSGGVPPAWVSFGMARDNSFSPVLDLTGASLTVDLRSTLAAAVAGVLSIEIVAPVMDTEGIPVTVAGNPLISNFRLLDANLLDIPDASQGWQTMLFGFASELRDPDRAWARPILTEVQKINLLVLQTGNDFVAQGNLDIDNITASVPEPGAMLLCGFATLFGFIYRKRLNK